MSKRSKAPRAREKSATSPPAAASAPDPQTVPLKSVYPSSLPNILNQLGISLAVSTYQAGKVIFVRHDEGVVNTHFRNFGKPMGVSADSTRLTVGGQNTDWTYRNLPAVARKLEPAGKHDACFLPRQIHVTGDSALVGGGIRTTPGSNTTLNNSTVSDNTADYYGGIFNVGTLNLHRSLISGNSSTEFNSGNEIFHIGVINANDYNLFGHSGESNAQALIGFTPGVTDFNATSDGDGTSTHVPTALASILNTTLALIGGTTENHALVSGSPALDKAPNLNCTAPPINDVDQLAIFSSSRTFATRQNSQGPIATGAETSILAAE